MPKNSLATESFRFLTLKLIFKIGPLEIKVDKETKLKPTLFSKNKKLALSLTLTALLDNHWTVSNIVDLNDHLDRFPK